MTDLASLVLAVDSTAVPRGTAALDNLTAAGERADAAVSKLGRDTRTAGQAASEMAAKAQISARAAVGMAGGFTSVGMAANNARIVMLDMTHVGINMGQMLASGVSPMRALVMESGRLATALQYSGGSVKGLIRQFAGMVGILKVTRDAELAEEAANASAAAVALGSNAARARSAVLAADTEIALAAAQQRVAVTTAQASAAAEAMAAAYVHAAAAATDLTIAETALAGAQERAAVASEASAAKTVTSVGRVGVALGVTAIAVGVLVAALKGVKDSAGDGAWQEHARQAGLTEKEIRKLTDTTVTWGDVFASTMDVILERGGVRAKGVKSAWQVALGEIAKFGQFSIAILLGGFAALVKFVASGANDIGLTIGKGIAFGVNKGLEFFEKLINGIIDGSNRVSRIFKALGIDIGALGHVSLGRIEARGAFSNPLTDARNQLFKTFGDVMGGFAKIGALASARRDNRVQGQIDEIVADRTPKKDRAGAHKAAKDQLSDEEKAYQQALKAAQAFDANLVDETARIGKNTIELKQMEIAAASAAARKAAAVAPTKAMKDALLAEANAIDRDGAAWVAATKAQNAADFIKNQVEPLEQKVKLLGLSEEAQARANLEAEKGKIIAEAGADAWARYYAAQSALITAQFAPKNPLKEWADQIPQTAAEITTALQGIEAQGLDSLTNAITDVITGTKSLGAAFSDVARSVIADIIQMTVRMLIFRAISGLFGSPSTSLPGMSTGDMLSGNVFSFSGARASGGPVMAGQTYLVGERGPELFKPMSSGAIIPNNRFAANAGGEVRVVVELDNDVLHARIINGAAGVVAEAAPGIANAGAEGAVRVLTRPRLMGGVR